ncbi:hypothetical protein FT643_22565 [Ketobacter sp. MCCC 1A13808]|uniref:hypothetical protein n=1 Tax=Ketobacter sp. MCCC 1A13808 TaxID=2602738 RepID=UPI0012EB70DD|nr:hypothetical protein [Ketobacter sp. MCCC 1A13808]MVF14922.1 hypothetical protein [Ketobacter sp. MCCC 1A13808]
MEGVIAINREVAQSLNQANLTIIPNGMDLPDYEPVQRDVIVEEFSLDAQLPIFLGMAQSVLDFYQETLSG